MNFKEYIEMINSEFKFKWHHKVQCETIDKWIQGYAQNLIILAPPGTGKTEIVSRMLPLYLDTIFPNKRVLVVSNSDSTARNLSRDFLRNHGTTNDNVVFSGFGNSITGVGYDYLLLDYQMSVPDSRNPSTRHKIWNYFTNTLLTRKLTTESKVLIVASHLEDDITSRILSNEYMVKDYSVVRFPLVGTSDNVYRRSGNVLGNMYNIDEITKLKQQIGVRTFSTLMQQEDVLPQNVVY
jgi:hypothetical protein